VETFHVASECNTAVYFYWCSIQAFAQPVQLFWLLVTFRVASCNSLTDSDLQLFIETEQYRTRHTFIQYKFLKWTFLWGFPPSTMICVFNHLFLLQNTKRVLVLLELHFQLFFWINAIIDIVNCILFYIKGKCEKISIYVKKIIPTKIIVSKLELDSAF